MASALTSEKQKVPGPISLGSPKAHPALSHYRATNQRVTLLLLQPVDKPPTGCVGRVSPPCVPF